MSLKVELKKASVTFCISCQLFNHIDCSCNPNISKTKFIPLSALKKIIEKEDWKRMSYYQDEVFGFKLVSAIDELEAEEEAKEK